MDNELSKGFTGIEINGVKFSNIKEMLIYMNKQRDHITDLEKENAELKEQISTKDILIKELQEQKAYWKESSFDWRHKFFKLDKVKRLIKKDKQLSKAKDLLLRFIELKNKPCAVGHSINMLLYDNICAEIKQFLNSEVEK